MTPDLPSDPLASARITLAGIAEKPAGAELAAARDAHVAAVPAARYYIDYSDFAVWVLRVQRVRWVGGYGRMDSATGESYADAAPDPVVPASSGAVAHLNDDHADSLLAMAQRFGGFPDATEAKCLGADRYGLELRVSTPRGFAMTRVGYAAPISSVAELRAATVDLARRARVPHSVSYTHLTLPTSRLV